jgi:hypothetical protein
MCLGALEEAITQVVTAEDVVAPDWLSVHARRPATRAQA